MIYVINKATYDGKYKSKCIYNISRPSPLGNPFTHNGKKSSLAKLSFETREEAIEAFKMYFKKMYGKNNSLTKYFDEIYNEYKLGNDIYLQCWCKPLPCHGDIIKSELEKKYLREKINEKLT